MKKLPEGWKEVEFWDDMKLAPIVQEKQSFSAQKDTLVLLVQEIGDTK